MAKTPVNSALRQVRGGIDGWVYRLVDGKTVIAKAPPSRDGEFVTAGQRNVRERFRRAASYAEAVYRDPVRRARYQNLASRHGVVPGRVFSFILQDYARPPVISLVELRDFKRLAGDPIAVYADDEGEITQVTVTLKTDDGTVLEQGAATFIDAAWVYRTVNAYPDEGPITIEAEVRDLPDNRTVMSVISPPPGA